MSVHITMTRFHSAESM